MSSLMFGEWHLGHNQPLLATHKVFTIVVMQNRGLYLGVKAHIENPAVHLWQAASVKKSQKAIRNYKRKSTRNL